MKIKQISKTALYIICAVFACMLGVYTRSKIHNLKVRVEQGITAYNILSNQDQQNQLMISRQGDSLKIANQIILSQKQAIEMGILNEKDLRDKYLKEVNNVVRLSEEVEILKKQGKWIDTVYIDTFNEYEWLRIPSSMLFEDKWYRAEIIADRIPLLNSLVTYSEPTITIGIVKKGILKKPEKLTIYENANPYIKLRSMESVTIKDQIKWYQTTWFKVGVGFIGGVLIIEAVH